MLRAILAAALALVALAAAADPAFARHRHHGATVSWTHQPASQAEGAQILSHPAGCPRAAFCGCGAAVRIFGRPRRELWLVAAWPKLFPRAAPAPGRAAIRRDLHHIMVLEADLGGGIWQVYDANSGGRATRRHARSLVGYFTIDPRGRS